MPQHPHVSNITHTHTHTSPPPAPHPLPSLNQMHTHRQAVVLQLLQQVSLKVLQPCNITIEALDRFNQGVLLSQQLVLLRERLARLQAWWRGQQGWQGNSSNRQRVVLRASCCRGRTLAGNALPQLGAVCSCMPCSSFFAGGTSSHPLLVLGHLCLQAAKAPLKLFGRLLALHQAGLQLLVVQLQLLHPAGVGVDDDAMRQLQLL